jgi:hypothetical protein
MLSLAERLLLVTAAAPLVLAAPFVVAEGIVIIEENNRIDIL